MTSMTTFKTSKVGCPHIRSTVKNTRAESNSIHSAINDMIDNILNTPNNTADIHVLYKPDGKPYKFIISDNIEGGFENILDEGINNPLNLGHIRAGQLDDSQTSEFGTGLKKAIIFASDRCDIYTSIVKDGERMYIHITFEIPAMCSQELPENSFEPTCFEKITEETYRRFHKYETGSSIILSELQQQLFTFNEKTGKQMTKEELETFLYTNLQNTYSKLIHDNYITILLNGNPVQANEDILVELPADRKIIYRFYLDNSRVFRVKYNTNGRISYSLFDPETNKFSKIIEITDMEKIPFVIMTSLTTYESEYSHILKNDTTEIIRNGRSYGTIKITKEERDGYSNHIYTIINYDNKLFNPLLGIGPNKQLFKKTNILMAAIHATQKERTSQLRKFCKYGKLNETSDSESTQQSTISVKKPKQKKVSKKISLPNTSTQITAVELEDDPQVKVGGGQSHSLEVVEDLSQVKVGGGQSHPLEVVEDISQVKVGGGQSHSLEVVEDLSQVKVGGGQVDMEEDHKQKVEESKIDLLSSIQILMDMVEDINFNRIDGHELLDLVNKYKTK